MTDFEKNSTKVRELILDGISFDRRRVKIRLALKNSIKGLVLTLANIFYLLYSLLNLISLGLLNNVRIFYHNKNQILYNQKTQKVFAFVEYYNISFLLHPLNLSIVAVSPFKHNDIYKSEKQNI